MELTKKKVVFGVLSVLLIWTFSAIIIDSIYDSSDRGTFGDMFGAVNALFSGLALFGIIVSILIQQKELNLQRAELSDTRKEFKINRITNILFKQVEYINSIIEKESFKVENFDGVMDVDFNYFFKKIEDGEASTWEINVNSDTLYSLINQLLSLINDFEYLLEVNDLNDDEKYQMKFLYRGNLKPNFLELLRLERERIKESLENESDFKYKKLHKIILSNLEKILIFGKKE